MAKFELLMPKMGESVIEATITKWLVQEGDEVEENTDILEIATDKVDSEIPSPVDGKIIKTLYEEGDVVAVGEVIAVISLDGDDENDNDASEDNTLSKKQEKEADVKEPANEKDSSEAEDKKAAKQIESEIEELGQSDDKDFSDSDRFYSPLVKSIAKTEGISVGELDGIKGSGQNGRVTKQDMLKYLETRASQPKQTSEAETSKQEFKTIQSPAVTAGQSDRIEEMDRMRKMIADHMVMSKQVSPHVTSFIEVDVSNIVIWRNSIKNDFLKREGEKITFTPIFIEAASKALRDFPGINASVDGKNIIYRKNINVGMATALPDGNLIVPVIKNADQKNLVGMAKTVNDLANRARANKLNPDDISGGTFTVTNFGSFESLTGTPIINQPQVAILGLGAVVKKPVVIETENGDVIGIRSMMILSLAYDHRIVDGALAGKYLKAVRDYLQNFDTKQTL
jgi:2-oxoglutarate dehydrogenase E2 component (dihydrolipoamide succinyltransferase)